MTANTTRRRFLLITAGAGAGVAGWSRRGVARQRVTWRGVSLGARAEIVIDHADRDAAEEAVAACRQEIARLEDIFSLYRVDSLLTRLNADGRIDSPAAELVELLSIAASVHAASGGAFDPTVQPLWRAYACHYTGPDAASEIDLHAALQATGFDRVRFDGGRVSFAREGMALTLNGVAQGYVTDRVARLLRARGFRNVLVDMGEIRALGPQRDGRAWPVPIAGSHRIVELDDRAIATSATLGTTFDAAGRVGHILDPSSGRAITAPRQVSVVAPTAALADALSTALCILSPADAAETLAAFPEARLVNELA